MDRQLRVNLDFKNVEDAKLMAQMLVDEVNYLRYTLANTTKEKRDREESDD